MVRSTIQVPLRARAIELASEDQQPKMHAIFSAFAGLGAGGAYLVAFQIDPVEHSGSYMAPILIYG